MVQVIGQGRMKPLTASQKLGMGLSDAMNQYISHAQKDRNLSEENQAANRLGIDLSGIRDPKMREAILSSQLQGKREESNRRFQSQTKQYEQFEKGMADAIEHQHQLRLEGLKGQKNQELNDKRYNTIRDRYGKEAADFFDAAPEGGKTAIIQHLIENEHRTQGLNKKLGFGEQEKPQIKSIDYDKGLTPKERVKRQDQRYDRNLPLYQANQDKTVALEHEQDSLESLSELSPQISGWERLNINPQTGSLIIPALASPEAQRFVKTVNDFTVNAKDSFGARVSNFELDRFMQRLPTLANSEEGRSQIIRQMQIINEMNLLRNQSLKDVFEEHGGIRNIDYDEAERATDKMIKPRMAELKNEFKKIDNGLDKQYQKKVEEDKRIVPKDHVAVQKADGTRGYIKKDKLKKFLSVKGNKAL